MIYTLLIIAHLFLGILACRMFYYDVGLDEENYFSLGDILILTAFVLLGFCSFIVAVIATGALPPVKIRNPFFKEKNS